MSNINFHQTFPPTTEYISRILEITDMELELTKEEISELTGIPTGKSSGKVEPHIYYAQYMGLVINISKTRGKYKLVCTELGRIIKTEDIGLHEVTSQLLCHSRITSPSTGAFVWSTIIREILPSYPNGIKLIILNDELKKKSCFAKNLPNTSPFFSSYRNCFGALSLFSKDKDTINIIHHSYKKQLLYVYAYALLYEWEQVFPFSMEITSSEMKKLYFASAFGFSEYIGNQIIESMNEKKIIVINGQLSPYTVLKTTHSSEVLSKAYSIVG